MKKITLFIFLFGLLAVHGQSVSSYQFAQTVESYTAVGGALSSATGDDGLEDNLDIGFEFPFAGATFTTFSISTNGFIRLGAPIGGNSWINTLSNEFGQNIIAPFWDDNNRNLGTISYSSSGVSPNRTLEVGWEGVNIGGNGTTNSMVSATFKLRLHEDGQIDFVYGSPMTWVGGITASIGLNDGTSFLSVSPAVGTSSFSTTTANNAVLATSDLPGVKYVFSPPPACAGIPDPGMTLASMTSLCPGQEISLSLENTPAVSSLSYQWQSSVNGTSYVNIDGATSATLEQFPNVDTYYRCIVICNAADGGSAISTPVEVAMNSGCYCIPTYTAGKTDGDLISNVAIAGTTLANNTGTDPVNPSYTHFTGQPNYTATLQTGVQYEIQVTVGSYGQQNSAVWVDYNDDLQFDASERVGYTGAAVGSFETATYTILLDCTAPPGVHRMRVRDVWNTAGATIDPCINYGYGETEDYDITIAPAGCAAPYALAVNGVTAYQAELEWTAGCGQSSWDVHVALPGQGLPGGVISDPGVTDNPVVINGLMHDTAYEYYVRAHCDNGGTSDWAGPFAFTTGPVPPDNDECQGAFALAVGGVFGDDALVSTNLGASGSLDTEMPSCAAFNFGGDVWFSAEVPASGNITFETQADAGSDISDTGMAVYSGMCGSLTDLGCSDDEGVGAFSLLSLTGRTPGETLYVRVWEYANDAFGTFKVSAYDASLGVAQQEQSSVVAYPNPVTSTLNISGLQPGSRIKVSNMLGQSVLETTSVPGVTSVDVGKLPAGTYLVSAASGAISRTFKIVKQ